MMACVVTAEDQSIGMTLRAGLTGAEDAAEDLLAYEKYASHTSGILKRLKARRW